MNILITAGPTREPIDPVRFLSNRSSGKMGYALAQAAVERGHEVTLITGPTCLTPPATARVLPVETAMEMLDATLRSLDGINAAILCAAVSDYRPANPSPTKLKRSKNTPDSLALVENPDILATLGHLQTRNFFLAGFAAETDNVANNAKDKLRKKNCDMIVANLVGKSGTGFEADDNEVVVFMKSGEQVELPRLSKHDVAHAILAIIEKH